MEFDYKTLELLRKCTWLDPISKCKVLLERRKANLTQQMINELENCQIGVDYTKANQLEAELRFEALKKEWQSYRYKYYYNTDPDDFAFRILIQQENVEKKHILKRTKKL